jgi:hypothetical protein
LLNAGATAAVLASAAFSLGELYRVGVADSRGRWKRLRHGAWWLALPHILARLVLDGAAGLLAYLLLTPGLRFREQLNSLLSPTSADIVFGIAAGLSGPALLRREPRSRERDESRTVQRLNIWRLHAWRQHLDDSIADCCYKAMSRWKRQVAVPAILRISRDQVRFHLVDWLENHSGLTPRVVASARTTIGDLLSDTEIPEDAVSTLIEKFLALTQGQACIDELVFRGRREGWPGAFLSPGIEKR